MISRISGIICDIDIKGITVDVHGVGYDLSCTTDTMKDVALGRDITLWTHHVVREDAQDLYGFLRKDELNFFKLLIGISGIGPKTALGILNVASIETLISAISSGDTSHLTKVSGIGKKNADKIVLELKDKVDKIEGFESVSSLNETDTMEALRTLGYSQYEAREAMKKIDKTLTKTNDKIKAALKILGK